MSRGRLDLSEIDSLLDAIPAPSVVPALPLRVGGVDPLGLRQLNFNLMDQCIPGLNNTAFRLRPYTLVAWAWWRAAELARAAGMASPGVELLKSFVERIEIIFAVGHLVRNNFGGILGSDTLNARVVAHGGMDFSSESWTDFRHSRELTTSLMAPVSYGPSAKEGVGMCYLAPAGRAFAPLEGVMPAVLAFHRRLDPVLLHDAFGSLDCGWLPLDTMLDYYSILCVDQLEEEEVSVGRDRLYANPRTPGRARMIDLIRTIVSKAGRPLLAGEIRRIAAMADSSAPTADLAEPDQPAIAVVWRALQARQLLRLSLEGLLNWVLARSALPTSLATLTDRFFEDIGSPSEATLGAWLDSPLLPQFGFDPIASPVELIEEIAAVKQVDRPDLCVLGLRTAVLICREMGGANELFGGQSDRLPLSRISSRLAATSSLPLRDGLEMLISEWLIGQHIYWAVGRSGDDTQRLRIMLDEGGWQSFYGNPGNANPTPDRLDTLLFLATDCGLLARIPSDTGPDLFTIPSAR